MFSMSEALHIIMIICTQYTVDIEIALVVLRWHTGIHLKSFKVQSNGTKTERNKMNKIMIKQFE